MSKEQPQFKVAQVLDSLAMGGAEQLAVRIANGRARAGLPSFLYVLRDDGPLRKRIEPGVDLHFLDVQRSSIVNPFAFGRSLIAGHRKLARRIAQDGVVIVQTHLPNPNYWGLLLEMTHVCRAIPTLHNNQEFSYGRRGWRSLLNQQAYRLMLKKCGAVIGCSHEVRLSLLEVLSLMTEQAPSLVAVENGVDVPSAREAAAAQGARARYGIPDDVVMFVAAGRLTDQKDFRTLVKAASLLDGANFDFRVLIAGEGELRADLEADIARHGLAKKVLLPGNILDLPDLMLDADIFVLSSKYEGLPLVLLEAMASGLPVIGTQIKGVNEVIQEGSNALLFEVGKAEDLAGALRKLGSSPDQRKAFGASSRRRVQDHYNFAGVLEELAWIYAKVADGI